MPLWDLPEDDFLSKRRNEKGRVSTVKRKSPTTQKSTTKKSSKHYSKKLAPSSNKKKRNTVASKQTARAKQAERKASGIRNAFVAIVCVVFLVVFLADFKGCSSTKKNSYFELPSFDMFSVMDSIGDAIFGNNYSYNNSFSYSHIKYTEDVELKSDVYLLRNQDSEKSILLMCLYQIPEFENEDDYVYLHIDSKLMYREKPSESYVRCSYTSFINDYYSSYNTPDESVKKIVSVNSEGWLRKDNDKPFISISYVNQDSSYGLDSLEGREYAVSIGDGDENEVKLFENVAVHEVTYIEMDEIVKGWVKEFNLQEKRNYEYY